MTEAASIRNFSIIAHIDHGKSTLADRLLERTGALTKRESKDQFLDSMDLERERGITIKARSVRLNYTAKDGKTYILNLIDTPGHVDFAYEVSRSLAACEGALLVVDASQGVEAQTLANVYLALDHGLEIIPVINKIDLPGADVERTKQQIEEIIGLDAADAILTSAKEGVGIDEVLEAIVARIPAPKPTDEDSVRALIFDSWYDVYEGVIGLVRVFGGELRRGMKVRLMGTGKCGEVMRLGHFTPHERRAESLGPGEVGFIVAGDQNGGGHARRRYPDRCRQSRGAAAGGLQGIEADGVRGALSDRGESVRRAARRDRKAAPQRREPRLRAGNFAGARLRFSRRLSRPAAHGNRAGAAGARVRHQPDRDRADGRLPGAHHRRARVTMVDNPVASARREHDRGDRGAVHPGLDSHARRVSRRRDEAVRGSPRPPARSADTSASKRVILHYELPLAEIVFDFYDRLKSVSRGYASLDYEFLDFRAGPLVKLDIRINGEVVDALSIIVHRDKAYDRGRALCEKMREFIPRQMFEVAIQAGIGAKIIARETVKALRKNVTAKCYGGDITRKRKLLEKQKEGKKRMKQVGRVEIPQEAFLALLKVGE